MNIYKNVFIAIPEIHTSGPIAMYLIPEKMNTIAFGYQMDLPKKSQNPIYRNMFACTHLKRICTAIRKAVCSLGGKQ